MRRTFTLILCALGFAGCASPAPTVGLGEDQCRELVKAVNDMSGKPSGYADVVPPAAWPEPIRRVQPLAVYHHMANLVIVLQRNAHEERGYYVHPWISSYIPWPNEPNWTWVQVGNVPDLYAYTRKR